MYGCSIYSNWVDKTGGETISSTDKPAVKVCETPQCGRTNLVHSGTDAFMIAGGGAPTERFCYTCLYAYDAIRTIITNQLLEQMK